MEEEEKNGEGGSDREREGGKNEGEEDGWEKGGRYEREERTKRGERREGQREE